MWRDLSERTQRAVLLGVGFTVGVYLSLLAGSWFAKHAIEKAIADRTGLVVHMARPTLGLRSVRMRQLSVTAPASGGLRVHVGSLTLHTGLLGWVRKRTDAIHRVDLDDARVIVDVANPSIQSLIDRIRTRARDMQASARDDGPTRHWRVRDVRIEVWKAKRPVVRLWEGHAATEDDPKRRNARLEFAHGRLHTPAGDEVRLKGIRVLATRRQGTWRVEQALVGALHATLAHRAGDRTGNRAGDVVAAPAAPNPPTAAQRATRSHPALADLGFTTLAGQLVDWLAPTANLQVQKAEIFAATPSRPQLVLGRASLSVHKREHVFHTTGGGSTAHDGQLSWDLHVQPAQLRAEGNLRFRSISLALVAPFLMQVPWFEPEQSKLDGELVVRSEGVDEVVFQGDIAVQNASLYAPRLAPAPIRGISSRVTGQGKWIPKRRRLELYQAALHLPARTPNADSTGAHAAVTLRGALEWAPDHYLVQIDSTMPATPCQNVVDAIPNDLLGEYSGFQLQGLMSGKLTSHIDSRALDHAVLDIKVSDSCEFVGVPAPADVSRFASAFTHQVVEPDGQVFQMETGPQTAQWTPLGSITMFLVHAILAHEDGGFWGHHGFYVRSIRDALVVNLKAKRYRKGASTITMQTVKNLFLKREKTLARKMQEAVLTWMIEHMLRKSDILELYLNVIEYGPRVYGIRDAARYYFNTTPDKLTPAQSVYLATLLPNPKLYSASARRGYLSDTWITRIRRILEKMYMRGQINKQALEYGIAELRHFGFHGETPLPSLPMGEPASLSTPLVPQDLPPELDDPADDIDAEATTTSEPTPEPTHAIKRMDPTRRLAK
jgi:hypothetical protein